MKKLIVEFLEQFATKATEGVNVELLMDDHFYIEFEGEGFYIPENRMMYEEDDYLIVKVLQKVFTPEENS